MKANVSACIIVKNDPLLEKCLQSIRDYVDEIVVVDTGSTDDITHKIAQKYADIFEVYTECNDPKTGLIEDFSLARQRSFDLATNDWVLWLDSDDTIVNADNINKIIEGYQKNPPPDLDAVAFLFPYEYFYNEQGQCTCLHYRERLFSNKRYFHWLGPIHEVVVANENSKTIQLLTEDVLYKHGRQFSPKPQEPGRNLRILRKYFEKTEGKDPRQMYYLGLETAAAGLIDEAIGHLSLYIDRSGWDDERAMACLKLIEIYLGRNDIDNAMKWAFKCISIKEDWGEGYFALSKMFYHLALQGGIKEMDNWKRCANFAKMGLDLPPTKTLLFINPLERDCEIHKYYNMALNKMGRVKEALESVKTGMLKYPNDSIFVNNKKLYEEFLARQEITNNATFLKNNGILDQAGLDIISAIINSQPIPMLSTQSQQLQEEVIEEAEFTPTRSPSGLDIVFFAGDGLENWTPDTIKKTGHGGSELMLSEMARRFAILGHRVRVYNSCGVMGECSYNGVEYYQTSKYYNLDCDVLIVSRRADALSDTFQIRSKLKLLWVHDIFALNATNNLLLQADKILALSEWHKKFLMQYHNLHSDHIITTRNGIDLIRFDKKINRNQYKCMCSSSPDRYLPVMLDMWPRIKQLVPKAEFHIFYSFYNWEQSVQHNVDQLNLIKQLKNKIQNMKSSGVVYRGRVNQEELTNEFLSAGVWTYSTFFSETSCISAMEAQAGGCRMITSNIAALNETAGVRAVLIDGEWTTKEYQDQFIEATVKALNRENNDDRLELQTYAKNNFGLDQLANEWNRMFYELIELKKTNPIIPYQPTKEYK